MGDKYDFERAERSPDFERRWLAKLSRGLREKAGEDVADAVMEGAEALSSDPDGREVIEWTCGALDKIDELVDETTRNEVLADCACQYPRERLEEMRKRYTETGDLDLVHGMLREQFLETARGSLGLDEGQIEDIKRRGWGVAGVRKGDRIIATKMPFRFHEFFEAETPTERRYQFCHCPRVREMIREGDERLSAIYCYCGAGFYKGIWEHILGRPVMVEVLESVLKGDDLCRIAIHLPPDAG
jgi:hypothetical protein